MTKRKDASDLGQLWADGHTLEDALEQFGHPDLAARHAELKREPTLHMLHDLQRAMASGQGNPKERLAHGHAIANEWENVRAVLEEEILGMLREGALLGLGIPRRNEALHFPEEIPPILWDGEVDWQDSRVSLRRATYDRVRVIKVRDNDPAPSGADTGNG